MDRRAAVDPTHSELSVAQQCTLLAPRSSFYYHPVAVSEEELELMRWLDEQYTATPFYGSRRMQVALEALDWFSRYVLAWELSVTVDGQFCVDALETALRVGVPEIFNTDQGAQLTAAAFTTRVEAAGAQVSMDGRGRALDNVFVERLWRSVKYEEVYLHDYGSVPAARASGAAPAPLRSASLRSASLRSAGACHGRRTQDHHVRHDADLLPPSSRPAH